MSPKADVSAERIPQILQAATRVFARCGIDAASMKEIAQEAGLSIGGVYWYYETKDQILFDLVKSFIEKDLAEATMIARSSACARQRLEKMMLAGLAGAVQLMPLTLEIYRQSLRNAEVRAALQGYLSAYRELFRMLFEQGIAGGEFRPVNSDTAAQLLIALYNGALELSLLDGDVVRVADTLTAGLTLLFEGLSATK